MHNDNDDDNDIDRKPPHSINWGEAFLEIVLPGIPFVILALVAYASGAYRPLYGW